MREEIAESILQILRSGQRGALATVVRTSGSTPQQPGARMLLFADGTTLGTVGGGAIEHAVLTALETAREHGTSELVVRELGYDLGMCCGGRMEIFVEPLEAKPRLVLCGAGHVAQATAQLARGVGFGVSVVDEREELNNESRFPDCTRELTDPSSYLRRHPPAQRDYVLIATHDHQLDEQCLARALEAPVHYVGLVGSKRKVFRLLERILQRQDSVVQRALERVYAPVGLDLGAVGPEEIALSIVAELVAMRRGKPAAHLRAVDDPRFRKLLERASEEPRK